MNNFYTLQPTSELQGQSYGLWNPDDSTNSKMKYDSNITSNWKYRQYMQKNANEIMKYNTMQMMNSSGNNPYTVLNTSPVGNTPYLYNSTHDNSGPAYGFRNTDLKQSYMTKEQMKSRMIAPSIPTIF